MSCDTFVALPPKTNGCIIFGKNSDRPSNEVQEIVYEPAKDHGNGSTLQCTYIAIPQSLHTHAVILSKPAWMWGAEMGANEHGVCIGNEAVWTKFGSDADKEEKLLGMDLVRLGLERGGSAKEALDVITQLLEEHGQGGPCYEDSAKMDIVYHNSFIIADGIEAWVLETAAKHWAAEKITSGVRNLSNLLTIGTKIDLCSSNLKAEAEAAGFWTSGSGDLDFAKALSSDLPTGVGCPGNESPEHRYTMGKSLLKQGPDGSFNTAAMISILRDEESGICRLGHAGSATMGSQVSVLYPPGSGKKGCHWFTGTPNPARSLFKPFVFTKDVIPSTLIVSPTFDNDPAKTKPRFQQKVDRSHALYEAHQQLNPLGDKTNEDLRKILFTLEQNCIHEMEEFAASGAQVPDEEMAELFADAVESESKFYPKCVKLN